MPCSRWRRAEHRISTSVSSSSSSSELCDNSLNSVVSASNSTSHLYSSVSDDSAASPSAESQQQPPPATFDELYSVVNTIGSGSYAVVYRCLHRRTFENFAVKVIEDKTLSTYQRQLICNEEAILQRLDHRNVIRLVAVFTNELGVKRMVFEFADQLDVCMALVTDPGFGEASIRSVARQLFEGLSYLHAQAIVHRDLKLENLLVKSDMTGSGSKVVKICDFGYAVTLEPGQTFFTMKNIIIGSFEYMSPELISSQEYSAKMDCWAAGVILYFLFTGDFPFKGNTVPEMVRCVMKRTFTLDFAQIEWAAASPNAVSLIKSILLPLYSRPTAKDLLKHAWFTAPLASNDNAAPPLPLPIMRQSERLQFLQQEADAKLKRLYNNSSSSRLPTAAAAADSDPLAGAAAGCWRPSGIATPRYRNHYSGRSHEAATVRELLVHSSITTRRRSRSLVFIGRGHQ